MIQRKIIAGALSASAFAVILAFIVPNPFSEAVVAQRNYFYNAITIINVYLLYAFPAIMTYGIVISFLADYAAVRSFKTSASRHTLSALLHLLFGLVLFPLSLAAAGLFFVIDRILSKYIKRYTWLSISIGLAVPILLFAASIGGLWLQEL